MSFKPNFKARETKLLGRYPGRNQYVSQYIHLRSGVERNAKQVGSRLQQLAEYAKEADADTRERRKCLFVIFFQVQ
jgi:hypothetical protein